VGKTVMESGVKIRYVKWVYGNQIFKK